MAGSSGFGELIQLVHVVPELDSAVEYWLGLGVGPFYEISHIPLQEQRYRNEPTNIDIAAALACSGSIQIELVVQKNDAPSLFREFLEENPKGGLHHLAFAADSFDDALATGERLGTSVVQQWKDQFGGRFAIFDRRSKGEPYVGVMEVTPTLRGFFEQIEKTATRWDGEEPRRVVG